MTSSALGHICKDPISKEGHIRRSWALGLPAFLLWGGGDTIQPITDVDILGGHDCASSPTHPKDCPPFEDMRQVPLTAPPGPILTGK